MSNPSDDIAERVKQVIAKKTKKNYDEISESSSFLEDMNLDSLAIVEVIMELEDEFDQEIPDSDAEKILTVGDAIEYIKSHSSGS
ncbi:MAG: acyl carrier protein [Hyphomicrobiales bacterium]|nr:acyl carrier protein [Hyphomicrobiales bacterium]MCY4033611.1 acyl carrier protein [Hyphomicrobiales bacterium]